MNNLGENGGDRGIDNEFDSVQMAIIGTDNYDVSMWWIGAIIDVGRELHPELENQIREIAECLSSAIHDYHPNIVEEKWNNRAIKW